MGWSDLTINKWWNNPLDLWRYGEMGLPILCLDFDGVIHSYSSGWKGADVIPDPPVEGALEFIERVVNSGKWELHIYSSRSNQPGGINAMQDWLIGAYCNRDGIAEPSVAFDTIIIAVEKITKWPTEKPPALVTIDDRAICFTGEWPDLNELLDFKPWNKR